MALEEARYEFRIWGDALDTVRDRLSDLAPSGRAERSRETYIVSDATDETNAKIRAGSIDLKLLVRSEQHLELWRPYLKAPFPLHPSLISDQIFAWLHVEAPPLCDSSYDANAFVNKLVGPHPRLAMARVSKRRWRFALEGCGAEFVEIAIESAKAKRATASSAGEIARLHTVAIESAYAQSVLAAISRLRLGARPNINYVRELKSILGRPRQ